MKKAATADSQSEQFIDFSLFMVMYPPNLPTGPTCREVFTHTVLHLSQVTALVGAALVDWQEVSCIAKPRLAMAMIMEVSVFIGCLWVCSVLMESNGPS